jgi:hypothetical protein
MWDESLEMMNLSAFSLYRCALNPDTQLWWKSSVGWFYSNIGTMLGYQVSLSNHSTYIQIIQGIKWYGWIRMIVSSTWCQYSSNKEVLHVLSRVTSPRHRQCADSFSNFCNNNPHRSTRNTSHMERFKLIKPWTERESNYRPTSLTSSRWPLILRKALHHFLRE